MATTHTREGLLLPHLGARPAVPIREPSCHKPHMLLSRRSCMRPDESARKQERQGLQGAVRRQRSRPPDMSGSSAVVRLMLGRRLCPFLASRASVGTWPSEASAARRCCGTHDERRWADARGEGICRGHSPDVKVHAVVVEDDVFRDHFLRHSGAHAPACQTAATASRSSVGCVGGASAHPDLQANFGHSHLVDA